MKRFCVVVMLFFVGCMGPDGIFDMCGFHVEQTNQSDIELLCEYVKACENRLDLKFDAGVTIKIEDSLKGLCPDGQRVSGCWWLEYDTIIVKHEQTLEATALCHEFLHRQLWIMTLDADYDHKSHYWDVI